MSMSASAWRALALICALLSFLHDAIGPKTPDGVLALGILICWGVADILTKLDTNTTDQ